MSNQIQNLNAKTFPRPVYFSFWFTSIRFGIIRANSRCLAHYLAYQRKIRYVFFLFLRQFDNIFKEQNSLHPKSDLIAFGFWASFDI